jgi:hypothetical protein
VDSPGAFTDVNLSEIVQPLACRPTEEVGKALHKWLRRYDITLDDDELTAKAAKISAGEAVELAHVPSTQDVLMTIKHNRDKD